MKTRISIKKYGVSVLNVLKKLNGKLKSKPLIFICWKATQVACCKYSLKLFLNSLFILRNASIRENDLTKVLLSMLLRLLSVIDKFIELYHRFHENSFQYK